MVNRGRTFCNPLFAYFSYFDQLFVPENPPAASNLPDRSCMSTELLGQSLRAQVKLRGVGVALLSTCPSHSREGQSRINVIHFREAYCTLLGFEFTRPLP